MIDGRCWMLADGTQIPKIMAIVKFERKIPNPLGQTLLVGFGFFFRIYLYAENFWDLFELT
jgi:hypothetical protein